MAIGDKIRNVRLAQKMTKKQLAEAVGVSIESVNTWENGVHIPSPEKRLQLEQVLHLSQFDDQGRMYHAQLFSEENMAAYLEERFSDEAFPGAHTALEFLLDYTRENPQRGGPGNRPYLSHPLTMTCHALAMELFDDDLLASLLLHDVPDVLGISPEDLPVNETVRHILNLVKNPENGSAKKDYYDAICEEPLACLVKSIDRCSVLSTLYSRSNRTRLMAIIRDTEKWYPPILQVIKENHEYFRAAWLMQYQVRSLLAYLRTML